MSERTALVIGNAAYPEGSELVNPGNDARDLSERLKRFGFTVKLVVDASAVELDRALKVFHKRLEDAEVSLVFFAGHGIQIDGDNFLIAIDTDTSDESSNASSISRTLKAEPLLIHFRAIELY